MTNEANRVKQLVGKKRKKMDKEPNWEKKCEDALAEFEKMWEKKCEDALAEFEKM